MSLLDSGANMDHPCDGETALFAAAKMGHIEVVQLLIEYGADLLKCNEHGVSPLDIARIKGNNTIVHILEEATMKKRKREDSSQEERYPKSPKSLNQDNWV